MVDILKADAVEARFLTGESDIGAAARTLAARGPSEIVLTHRDGLLVLADGVVYETEFHPKDLIGRSGRGDTCLGSYVARRLESPPAEAILWAAAVTSLKMEAEGPFHREIGDVVHLLQEKYAVPAEV
jgi:sugar/nucleoside kinase (ribokinase family)